MAGISYGIPISCGQKNPTKCKQTNKQTNKKQQHNNNNKTRWQTVKDINPPRIYDIKRTIAGKLLLTVRLIDFQFSNFNNYHDTHL